LNAVHKLDIKMYYITLITKKMVLILTIYKRAF